MKRRGWRLGHKGCGTLPIALLLFGIWSGGCISSRTIDGVEVNCVGITKDDALPEYEYRLSTWNIIIGVIFLELIIPPIIVLVSESYCPVRKKQIPAKP